MGCALAAEQFPEGWVCMLSALYEALRITSTTSQVIISVSLMLMGGFLATRITKRLRLPHVTAYIVTGILMGPFCLNLVPRSIIEGMDFIADIALAFIAFGTGEYFRMETLKKSGARVLVITALEACLASAAVFAVTYWGLRLELNFSLVLAALASATASASTMMTIRQTHAKGDFVDTLLQVVALDNVLSLLAFSVAVSVAMTTALGTFSAVNVIRPLIVNILVFLLGGLFGVFLKWLLQKRSTDNRLIVSVALLFAFCGVCTLFDVSPLLGCMSMGMVYINRTGDERLFKQLNYFSPPLLLLFFVRSGLYFDLGALFSSSGSVGAVSLLTVGLVYFFVRVIGKYAGSYLGCLAVKKDRRVRHYLGLALIPQAGVAIGLAAMGARTLGGEVGRALETIVLAASVLYELIGPACAKLSLYLSGSYSTRLEELVPETASEEPPKTEVEQLIARIHAIQAELPRHDDPFYEDEKAFSEAAEEHYAHMTSALPDGRARRRTRV